MARAAAPRLRAVVEEATALTANLEGCVARLAQGLSGISVRK